MRAIGIRSPGCRTCWTASISASTPGGIIATNFVLHGISACLLFVLLRRLTGAFWPSASWQRMFAVHPLRVESVAWIAERKDVLSGLFFFLTLLAYESYVRRGRPRAATVDDAAVHPGADGQTDAGDAAAGGLAPGLLAAGSVPRRRGTGATTSRARSESRSNLPAFVPLFMEKVPWLILSAASCAITIVAQKQAILSFDRLPIASRCPNALDLLRGISEAGHLAPEPGGLLPASRQSPPLPVLIGAIVLLAGISLAAVMLRRRCPYLLVGWLWYVGMLVPVIGLVQVGGQAMADRYTYLPLIGIFISLAWAVRDVVVALAANPRVAAAAGGHGWPCRWWPPGDKPLTGVTTSRSGRGRCVHPENAATLNNLGRSAV